MVHCPHMIKTFTTALLVNACSVHEVRYGDDFLLKANPGNQPGFTSLNETFQAKCA